MTEEKLVENRNLDQSILVIAQKTIKDYIWVIAQRGLHQDEITLEYKDDYESKVRQLIYYMEKCFGWEIQDEPGKVERDRVYYNEKGEKQIGKIYPNQIRIGKLTIWKY